MSAKRRLFFALWPTEVVRASIQTGLQLQVPHTRALPPENWHITLAFMGGLDAEQEQQTRSVADAVQAESFAWTLDHLGFFKQPRVIWAGPRTVPTAAQNLATQLREGLGAYGIPFGLHAFNPHLTLLRKAREYPVGSDLAPVYWAVEHFVLVHSEFGEGAARYELLDSWALSPAAE